MEPGLLTAIRDAVRRDAWQVTEHALDRLASRGILATELADAINEAVLIEQYNDYFAGPCLLLLQADHIGAVHALWGLRAGTTEPAILITAYRPDPTRWHDDDRTRR